MTTYQDLVNAATAQLAGSSYQGGIHAAQAAYFSGGPPTPETEAMAMEYNRKQDAILKVSEEYALIERNKEHIVKIIRDDWAAENAKFQRGQAEFNRAYDAAFATSSTLTTPTTETGAKTMTTPRWKKRLFVAVYLFMASMTFGYAWNGDCHVMAPEWIDSKTGKLIEPGGFSPRLSFLCAAPISFSWPIYLSLKKSIWLMSPEREWKLPSIVLK